MAINSVAIGSTLRLQFQIGVDGNGNPVYRNKSLNNVKPQAAVQDIYDVSLALANLQENILTQVQRVDSARLEEVV